MTVLGFAWSGAGTASGAAFITAVASLIFAIIAWRNSRKNGNGSE